MLPSSSSRKRHEHEGSLERVGCSDAGHLRLLGWRICHAPLFLHKELGQARLVGIGPLKLEGRRKFHLSNMEGDTVASE